MLVCRSSILSNLLNQKCFFFFFFRLVRNSVESRHWTKTLVFSWYFYPLSLASLLFHKQKNNSKLFWSSMLYWCIQFRRICDDLWQLFIGVQHLISFIIRNWRQLKVFARWVSDVGDDLSWYFCWSCDTGWWKLRTIFRSLKLSLEPQESTNPSKLSGIITVKPVALSWLKRKKEKSTKNQKGTFFLTFISKGGNIILFWFLCKLGLQVLWYLIRTT